MCNRCGIIIIRFDIVQRDGHSSPGEDWWLECLRPQGHEGPHLVLRHSGEYISWEHDKECVCQDCLSEDPNDWCMVYGEVSNQEAELLIGSAEYEGKE